MAKAPDTHEPPLSRKAREIKKQIDEGRYEIDLAALADALVDAGALDDNEGPADDSESGPTQVASDMAQNDQKSGDE